MLSVVHLFPFVPTPTQRNKTVGAASTAAAAAAAATVEKKKMQPSPPAERPADPCRDPITLDDLGSWTWDFRASEAATPPVSCGATSAVKATGAKHDGGCGCGEGGGGGAGKGKGIGAWGKGRGGGGGSGGGRGGCGGYGSGSSSSSGSGGSSSAVVTYNVESLVLYLLESGDFQVRVVEMRRPGSPQQSGFDQNLPTPCPSVKDCSCVFGAVLVGRDSEGRKEGPMKFGVSLLLRQRSACMTRASDMFGVVCACVRLCVLACLSSCLLTCLRPTWDGVSLLLSETVARRHTISATVLQEPTTRRPFSLVQLADLDALAAKAGAKVNGSLVTSYHEGQDKYRERRERRCVCA